MKNSELNDEVEGFWNYFRQEAAPVIRQHQSAMCSQDNLKEGHVALVPLTLETFAAEVLQCLQGLHVHEIWKFMRIITQGGIKYLCLRPDVIPGLKPSSIVFIRKSLSDSSLGIRSDRRDFLETPPKPGETIEKLARNNGGKQFRCTSIYLKCFSEETQQQLIKATSYSSEDLDMHVCTVVPETNENNLQSTISANKVDKPEIDEKDLDIDSEVLDDDTALGNTVEIDDNSSALKADIADNDHSNSKPRVYEKSRKRKNLKNDNKMKKRNLRSTSSVPEFTKELCKTINILECKK